MAIIVRGVTPLLEVFDMHRSVEFYRDVLGFEVVQTWKPDGHFYWAMLKLGGAVLMLNGRYEDDKRPRQPDEHRSAGHGDTELYLDCSNVDGAYSHLRAAGCPVEEPKSTHYGMRQVWVTDPDGFKLCFQSPSKNDEA